MKKMMLIGMLALVVFGGIAQCAEELVGTWQGTLKPGPKDLRIVIKISMGDDKLKGLVYSIDQGAPPIAASSVSRSGSTVKISVTNIGGSYEGKLSSDGNSIVGTWTQGGGDLPMTLARATAETAWAIPEPAPPPKKMPADAKPVFEVSTIKPAKPDGGFSLTVNRSGMLNTTSTSVSDLIKFAYDLHPRQITGGPSWVDSDRFDVVGKPDTPGMPSIPQLKMMMQKLLADRFELTFHKEQKELPVYAITITKGGHKLTKNDSDPNGLPGFGGGGPRGMFVRNASITEFAHVMQANVLEKPVVDQTGLGTARWDFVLKWTPDAAQRGAAGAASGNAAPAPGATPAAENPDAPPDLFAAFPQQLGLSLTSTKAAVDVVVIDKVTKPSEN